MDDFDDWVQHVRVVGYLRDHDVVCMGCRANLRGTLTPTCGACGTLNALPGVSLHDVTRRSERWVFRLAAWMVIGVVLFLMVGSIVMVMRYR